MMSDGKEEAIDRQIVEFFMVSALALDEVSPFDTVFTIKANGLCFPKDFNIVAFLHLLLHGFAGTQNVATYDEVNFPCEVRQVLCLFASGVASAYHSNYLLAIEEAVAGGTGRYAHTGIFLFVSQS